MADEDLKPFRFDLLREGDTFFSRSTHMMANIIAYAEAWGDSKEGRKRARAAVRDPMWPNHAGTVHDAHGQKYPVEASPKGYVRGDFDDYRTKHTWIVGVYRWKGYDAVWRRELCGEVLERWARKATRPKYDWLGAALSSPLGRWVLPKQSRNAANRLFCSEGAVYCLVICGLLGQTLPATVELADVAEIVKANPEKMPRSLNPVDVLVWMRSHPEFTGIQGVYDED